MENFVQNFAHYYVLWMRYEDLLKLIYADTGKAGGLPEIGGW